VGGSIRRPDEAAAASPEGGGSSTGPPPRRLAAPDASPCGVVGTRYVHARSPVAAQAFLARRGKNAYGRPSSSNGRAQLLDTDPLAFLRETQERYGAVKTENRLRASDHRALLDQFGFEIVAERDYVMVEGGSAVETEKPFELRPWVTSAVRDQMDAQYRNRDLLDLSTIEIRVLCRKR
jgi:hypothetical protein